jgi:hypothetical protein
MQLMTVKVEKPDDTNFILGQTHFIKSVEDIHEALVGSTSTMLSSPPNGPRPKTALLPERFCVCQFASLLMSRDSA